MSKARQNTSLLTSTEWDIATLRLANWTSSARPAQALLKQNYASGDGGGTYIYDPTDTTSADNGWGIIVDAAGNRWLRRLYGQASIDACTFGASPSASGATNRDAIQQAIDYQTAQGGGVVTFSKMGLYNVAKRTTAPTDRALVMKKGVTLQGAGKTTPVDTNPPVLRLVILQPSENMTAFISDEKTKYAVVTISNASPAVVTWNDHGLAAGDRVQFRSPGTLPTGVDQGKFYFVLAAGLTTNTFQFSDTNGGAAINTTGAGSGTITAFSAEPIHSIGFRDLVIYGGSVTTQHLVLVAGFFHVVENVSVEAGANSVNGYTHLETWLASWLNRYEGLVCGGFRQGVGFDFEGSDSVITNGIFSGSATCIRMRQSATTLSGCQIENANNTNDGGRIRTGTGLALTSGDFQARYLSTITGNRFIQNRTGISASRGVFFSTVSMRSVIDNNIFHANHYSDIDVGVGVQNLSMANNIHSELGSSGTVTISNASPAVFTISATHILAAGDEIVFATTGALPTGLTAGTRYFVIATGLTTTQFQVSATLGGSAINTSSAGSGTHTYSTQPFHIRFPSGSSTNTGCAAIGGHMDNPPAFRVSNAWNDFVFLFPGEDGQTTRFNRLMCGSQTQNQETPQTAGEFYANETVLTKSAVAMRIGLARNSSGFDAALVSGVATGTGPFIEARDGETTTSGDFTWAHRGTNVWTCSTTEFRTAVEQRIASNIRPVTDNTSNLGDASFRMATLYAVTPTINTSDARDKTPMRDLSDAEKRAARNIRIGAFQWLDAIESKGEDGARIHVGVIAQQVADALQQEGLDPARYAFWCADPLFEEIEHEETVTREFFGKPIDQTRKWTEKRPVLEADGSQKVRYGVRMSQLLAFKLAAID